MRKRLDYLLTYDYCVVLFSVPISFVHVRCWLPDRNTWFVYCPLFSNSIDILLVSSLDDVYV